MILTSFCFIDYVFSVGLLFLIELADLCKVVLREGKLNVVQKQFPLFSSAK